MTMGRRRAMTVQMMPTNCTFNGKRNILTEEEFNALKVRVKGNGWWLLWALGRGFRLACCCSPLSYLASPTAVWRQHGLGRA